jgi:pimeloyl-ACP methyl ester carboxylesterase
MSILRNLAAASAGMLLVLSGPAGAQITDPGTLEELKAEVQRRAEARRHPVNVYDPAEIRAGLATLSSKSEDDWASTWMAIGDRHLAAARREQETDPEAALSSYLSAYRYYVLGRWPTPTSPGKRESYRKGLEAFFAWDRLVELPTEVIEVRFGGDTLTGLLRMPATGAAPAPLIVQLGGLDGYKENAAMAASLHLARSGVAMLSLDSPGTGQSVRASPDAWRALDAVLEEVLARGDIDAARVALRGNSWGSYWATLMAHRVPERFVGVVAQGPPIHHSFAAERIAEVIEAGEYLFDWRIALSNAFAGVTTMEQLKAAMPTLSLETQGLLGRPTPPMLIVNGTHDEIFPIDDVYLLLGRGTAKEAWINPRGIHMGREPGVWDSSRIADEVILPWIFRRLGLVPLLPAAAVR